MAGESAEQVARRQREKAERLLRSAQMWERGAQGERATGAILDGLQDEGWAVFHDVRWPGRPRANLDHVVVGPGGVFVIDAKNWAGPVDVSGNRLRCNGRAHDKAVAAAGDAALAIAGVIGAPANASVRAVMCFVREERIEGLCHEVIMCSTANLREMLLGRPAVLPLGPGRVAAQELRTLLGPATVAPARTPMRHATPAPTLRPRRTTTARKRKKSSAGSVLKLAIVVVVALAGLTQLPRVADVASNNIATRLSPPHYSTCRDLRVAYPRGVGTSPAVAKVKRKHRRPEVNDVVYAANAALDHDHDGLACESGR